MKYILNKNSCSVRIMNVHDELRCPAFNEKLHLFEGKYVKYRVRTKQNSK